MRKASFTQVAAIGLKGLMLVAMMFIMGNAYGQAQCAMVCNNLVQVSMDQDCIVPITFDMILEGGGAGCPGGNFQVTVYKDATGVGGVLPTSPNVTVAVLNKTLLVKVKDLISGNSCWGHILVEDKLDPTCVIQDVFATCANTGNYTPQALQSMGFAGAFPTFADNCGTITTSNVTWFTDLGCTDVVGNLAVRNEVPAPPVKSDATGFVIGDYDEATNKLTLTITYSGLTGGLTASHVHTGAFGVAGPVAFNTGLPNGATSGSGTFTYTLTAAQETSLLANSLYVNLHTTANPAGEIRAQIWTDQSAVAKRTWTVTDGSGNHVTCDQYIYFDRYHSIDLLNPATGGFPADITLDCANGDTDPANTGTPYVKLPNGSIFSLSLGNGGCELNVAYTDQYFDICDGSFKILRTWVVYDWCAPLNSPLNPTTNPIYYIQLIKVLDTTGPAIYNCPVDYTVSVDAWACTKQLDLPTLSVDDDCSSIATAWAIYTNPDTWISQTISASISPDPLWTGKFLVNYGTISNAPIGIHSVTMYVEDDCGNVSTCQVDITVADLQPPVTICHEFTQIGLGAGYVDNFTCPGENGPNGSAPDVPGIAEVPAAAFDDGSYDKCGPVWLKVRRMDGGSCGGTTFDDFTRFCCSDIGGTWTVVLRAYDVNPGTGQISQDALDGHYNDCMVTVYVEDKIKPTCQAPAPVTTTCEQFDPLIWYGALVFSDNCGIKNIDTSYTYVPNQITFEQCNYGQVRRTFTVNDCSNNSSRCTQTITVHYKEQYRVYFPDDLNITVCNGPNTLVQPIIFGENCELIGISHEDEIFNVVPDACYKILRHWSVLNWCTYNPNVTPVNIPNSATSTQGARIWIGGNAAGTAPAWANYNAGSPEVSTVAALMINYPASLVNPGTPEYRYTQVIKVQDQTPPNQAAIDPSLSTPNYDFCDYTKNDPLLWNEDASYNPWGVDNTWSPLCNSHDLCEGPVDLSIRSTDACTGNEINFRYLLFLDLNGDGVMETTINSESPTLGFGIREDEIDGLFRIGRVTRDFESDDPDHTKYSSFELPYGNHKIKWIAEDRCGNDFTKEYPIIVRDCKNPTVVCINGLAVNQMNTPAGVMAPSVCLWATDFLQYAEDNCSLPFQIDIAIRDADINPGTGFPLTNGAPTVELCWDCSQLGTNTVELWARDKHGNADFCLTYLILSDNTGACGPTTGLGNIAGALKTSAAAGVAEAKVELKEMQDNPAFPDLSYFPNTADNGQFNFSAVPMAGNYLVTPAKDANYLNGVSTFDLVEMSKHILGVKKFTKGEQYLAADINNNKQVTTFDIVELRKLILGVYTELPNNPSWRFVDKGHVFDMTAPLAGTLPESKVVPTGSIATDFTGVKIGDLNGDAIANNLMQVDDRTNGTFLLNVEDKAVKAGEEFTVNFQVAEKVLGAQFTLNFGGLELVEILGGNGITAENFAVFAQESALTTSFDGNATEFAVKFRATTDGKISQFIGLSNRITNAEAYSLDEQKMEVAISFRDGLTTTIAGVAFELYQNEPNPVKGETVIRFNLPEASAATLTITDVQGRLLKIINTNGAKGLNTVVINRADLNASGVVFYQLDSASKSASKKMVIVD